MIASVSKESIKSTPFWYRILLLLILVWDWIYLIFCLGETEWRCYLYGLLFRVSTDVRNSPFTSDDMEKNFTFLLIKVVKKCMCRYHSWSLLASEGIFRIHRGHSLRQLRVSVTILNNVVLQTSGNRRERLQDNNKKVAHLSRSIFAETLDESSPILDSI